MTWHNPVIQGNRSVSQNKPNLNDNSDYIETTQRVDHFWKGQPGGVPNTHDGRHQFVQMPKLASPPLLLGTDMNGAYYTEEITKEDTTTENNAFFKNSNGHTSILGIRAACNVIGNEAVGNQTIKWQHNVETVNRIGSGRYLLTFSTALPSNFYTAAIVAYRNGTPLWGAVDVASVVTPTYNDVVKTNTYQFRTVDRDGNRTNAEQIQITFFGG